MSKPTGKRNFAYNFIANLERKIEQIQAENERLKNPWISVEDRYPDKKGRYLVILDSKYRTQKICKYLPCDRFIQNEFMPVTHWQPLPKPPEGES